MTDFWILIHEITNIQRNTSFIGNILRLILKRAAHYDITEFKRFTFKLELANHPRHIWWHVANGFTRDLPYLRAVHSIL